MYCSKCGFSNEEGNKFCQGCGASLAEEINTNTQTFQNDSNSAVNPNNQMPSFNSTHSIILICFSLLCCGGWIGAIFAILSLVDGRKVNDYAALGDYDNALRYKKSSEKWIKVTYIICAIMAALVIIYFMFVLFAGIASTM